MSEAGTENLLQIARVLKSNGTDGQLVLGFRDITPEDIDLDEPVFIIFDGLPVPFFINTFEPRGNKALVRLTGIVDLNDAEEVVGRPVYADSSLFEDYEDAALPAIIGWDLADENGNVIGKITDIEDIPGNMCIYVDTIQGQIMLPLHDDLIISINGDTSLLTLKIPQGLI